LETDRDRSVAMQCLNGLPGVVSVASRTTSLRILYEPAHLDYAGILAALAEAGVALPQSRWARLKSAWFSYLDGNARANANAGFGSCCSNPTDVYSHRGRRG
jgi:hypothetical protein